MKAIILAAGKGSRLGEYTKGKPKCLLKIGNETVLEREIRLLQEVGIAHDDIYVVGGYKYETLEDIAPNLIVNRDYDSKDNAYSLGLALQSVSDEDILILDSDLVYEGELLEEIIQCKDKNVLLSIRTNDTDESTGIVVDDDGFVNAIGKQYRNSGFVYISIFKIGQDTIVPLRDALLSERSEKTWYPLAITEICEQYKFVNLITEQKWHEIDCVEDYWKTLQMFEGELR